MAAADYKLGTLHSKGIDGQVDEARAVFYWKRAAAKRHPQALFNLGLCHLNGYAGTPCDAARAVSYLSLAAAAKEPAAMRKLGEFCLTGPRTPERNACAVKWFLLEDSVRHSAENPIFTRMMEFTEADLEAGLRQMEEWVNNPSSRLAPEDKALQASLSAEANSPGPA